jgi:hypothetical protein
MTTSSPVAIPLPNPRKRHVIEQPPSSTTPHSLNHDLHLKDPFGHSPFSVSTSVPYLEPSSPNNLDSDPTIPKSLQSPGSPFPDIHDYPFSPPPIYLSRSVSTVSSVSSPSIAASKLTRAFSPPREQVTANDPLCIFEEPDEYSDHDPDSESEKEQLEYFAPLSSFPTLKDPTHRRKSQLKSSLTASLLALKDKLPNSIPAPTLYTPPLIQSKTRSYSLSKPSQDPRSTLSASLPVFDSSTYELPASSAVHLQTYSVSFGPPRKPREARFNSDFLRLLALEMEMRRSGKFMSLSPENEPPGQGVFVSGKVKMVLPRRWEKERDDVNISTFNKSRLKW